LQASRSERASEVEEVCALGLVNPEGAGDSFEHAVGEIARPRKEVSAFAADPNNATACRAAGPLPLRDEIAAYFRTAWYKNPKAVEWETSPPVAVGSKLRFRAQFLGRALEYVYEVRELDPGRRFGRAVLQGPFPTETTYAWEDATPGTTRMILRNRGKPSGFAAVTAPVMTRAMRRANEADLRRLKLLLER
jgi:hypothetical protein